MPERGAVELVAEVTPLGHEFIHQADKVGIVRWLQKMDHFMDEYIFETFWCLLRKFAIEADCSSSWRAAAPTSFHASNNDGASLDTKNRLPLCNQRRNGIPNLITIPCCDHSFSFCHHSSRA